MINKEETQESLTKIVKKVVKAIEEERGQKIPANQVTDQADNEATTKLLEVYGKYFGCEMKLCKKQNEGPQLQNTKRTRNPIARGKQHEKTSTIRVKAGENRSFKPSYETRTYKNRRENWYLARHRRRCTLEGTGANKR